jgi:hypothetical protein
MTFLRSCRTTFLYSLLSLRLLSFSLPSLMLIPELWPRLRYMSSSKQLALCEFCKPLATIATRLENVRDIPYHESLEALKASALNGCVFCTWILENLPEFGISKLQNLRYTVATGPSRQYFSLRYLVEKSKFDRSKLRGLFHEYDNVFCFEGFYCNGRFSLLFTPNLLG